MRPHKQGQFNTGQLRHYNIRDKQVGRLRKSRIQCVQRRGEETGVEAIVAENQCGGGGDDMFVVNHKDATLFARRNGIAPMDLGADKPV